MLNGTKYYISGVDEAQALLVVARTGQDEHGGRLSLFIVPADAPGLDKHLLPVDLLLPERQFTLHFDGVRVSPGALVGERARASSRSSTALIPNGLPEPPSVSASRVMPWAPRPGTPPSARSGPSRSAPTRASRIRWPRPRSRPSSRR